MPFSGIAEPRIARSKSGSLADSPSIAAIAGRRNISAEMSAETGLPDMPRTGISPIIPKMTGLPGRMATFQKPGA